MLKSIRCINIMCNQCDLKTVRASRLNQHKQYHQKGICYHCDHTQHGKIQDTFDCNQCDHRVLTRERHTNHKVSMHNAMSHQCDIFDLRSTKRMNLQNYKKVKNLPKAVNCKKKIPHTGDTKSLDRCGS